MTRLIIIGRNSAMPRDVAQSMAHLMPTPWPSFADRLHQHMERHQFDDIDEAISDMIWRADNANE